MTAYKAVDRFIHRRPGAHYLHARRMVEEDEDRPYDIVRIRVTFSAITVESDGNRANQTMGSFTHSALERGLEEDVTTFNENLRRFLRRSFPREPDCEIIIGMTLSDANARGTGKKRYLKYASEPWI